MFLLFSFSLIKHLLHDLHVYLFLVLFHLFLVNFYAFRKLKDSGESCMGVRNIQNGARRSSAEKLTYTAGPKRHMAVHLADGGIRILILSLTSQGQVGDFTSINPRAGD